MRKQLHWAKVYYRIYNNNELIEDFDPTSCFYELEDFENCTHIEIYNIKCEVTEEYTEKYLNYIIDMLKLEDAFYDAENDIFRFKAFKNYYKTMLVGSLIRFLNEPMGYSGDFLKTFDQVEQFFKPLFYGKSRFRNKLKRFCDFYSKIKYKDLNMIWHRGHSWTPEDTKIKSTEDFLKYNEKSVNDFFVK